MILINQRNQIKSSRRRRNLNFFKVINYTFSLFSGHKTLEKEQR